MTSSSRSFRTNLIFVLPAPLDVISGRHFCLAGYGALRLVHEPANVAPAHVHQNATSQQTVFAADHSGPHHHAKIRNLSQRNLGTVAACDQHVIPQFFGILSEIRGVTHPHRQTLTTAGSVMFTGAGSIALSARPILPTTLSTSGSWPMIWSCQRRMSVARSAERCGRNAQRCVESSNESKVGRYGLRPLNPLSYARQFPEGP